MKALTTGCGWWWYRASSTGACTRLSAQWDTSRRARAATWWLLKLVSVHSSAMLLLPFLALLSLPFCLAASVESVHEKLVKLAAVNNGLIKLDDATYNLLTHPKRTWSASVHFTALDPRRRCAPCK